MPTAREKQAKIVVEDTLAYPEDHPQILDGDMNCDVSNKAIDIFKNAAWKDTYESSTESLSLDWPITVTREMRFHRKSARSISSLLVGR